MATDDNSSAKKQQPTRLPSYDVVGLNHEDHGRHCVSHMCCGHHVEAGDILVCEWGADDFRGYIEPCVKVSKVADDGLICCHVGYLQKRLIAKSTSLNLDFNGLVLRVVDDLRLSESAAKRARSHRAGGMAYCHAIYDDPNLDGRALIEEGKPFVMSPKVVEDVEISDSTETDDTDDN